jgi:hypothetical protein
MTTMRSLMCGLVLALASCAAPPPEEAELLTEDLEQSSLELAGGASPRLLQPGSGQTLLAVTGDDHVLYQEGTEVYASALSPGAQRQHVASVPAGNLAYVYPSGKVAFVWTNPDRSLPGYGVSPLWVWSEATGANFATDASPIGTYATSASPDGSAVLYPTRGNLQSGDLELASTDLASRTTMAAGIPMGFPFGPCRPWAGFVGRGGSAHPVALYCKPGESTATLTSWRGGAKTDLVSNVRPPPFFTADKSGTSFFVTLATVPTTALLVREGQEPLVVDQNVARTGFVTGAGVVYIGIVGGQLHLKRFDPATGERVTLAENLRAIHSSLQGSDLITRPWGSPDGKKLAFATQAGPGGLDHLWVDVRGTGPAVVVDGEARNWSGLPSFTADSKQYLFGRTADPATGLGAFFAHDDGATRQFSDGRGYNYLLASKSRVAVLDGFDVGTWTGVLSVVDLAKDASTPRRIASGVDATFLVSASGRLVLYTHNAPGVTAGLYVARTRP